MSMLPEFACLHNVAEVFDAPEADLLTDEGWQAFRERWGEWIYGPRAAPDGRWMSRIPNRLRLTLNPLAQLHALGGAGMEIRFNVQDGPARVMLQANDACLAEVLFGEFHAQRPVLDVEPTAITIEPVPHPDRLQAFAADEGHVFDPSLVRVCLPWAATCRVLSVEGDIAPPRPDQIPSRTGLFYGSSISHGSDSALPTQGYAPRTAARLGVDLINLGLAGGAFLEPGMADYLAGRSDWDFIHLEMGINLIDKIPVDDFRQRVHYLVSTVHAAHPDKPVFCTDLFTNLYDWQLPDKAAAFREVVAEAAAATRSDRVVHIDGRDILRSRRGLTIDLVHPSPLGMEEMAARLADRLRPAVAAVMR